jgi:cell division protein FtsW
MQNNIDETVDIADREKKSLDYNKLRRIFLIILPLALVALSTMNIASASFYFSMSKTNSGVFYFFTKQLKLIMIAVPVTVFFCCFPYHRYKNKKFLFFVLMCSVITLIMVLIFAKEIKGSKRWINIFGFNLQPSEFIKIAYIILLSRRLEKCREIGVKNLNIIGNIFPLFFIPILIFLGEDLGTTLHYFAITGVMLFASSIDKKIIISVVLLLTLAVGYFGIKSYFEIGEQGFRNKRVKSYIVGVITNEYDNDMGHQVKQSLIALGSGGLFGKGYGNGIQKYSYLPEIHTDFILASLGEELGFIGITLLLIVYLTIIKIGLFTALNSRDYFGRYLALGITSMIFIQVIMNVYVVTGLMPVTGIPLPLVSYGGSSLITILVSIGILFNVNKLNNKKKEEA